MAEDSLLNKIAKLNRKAQFKAADMLGLGDAVKFATVYPEQFYPESEQHNGRGDALRHLLLQGYLTQQYGETPAKAVGWLHEALGFGQPELEGKMDLHNDALGRQLGAAFPTPGGLLNAARTAVNNKKAIVSAPVGGSYAKGGLFLMHGN